MWEATIGKRSAFDRRPQDAYQTIDPRAVMALVPHLKGVKTFAEPCAGHGHLVRWLEAAGLACRYRDDIAYGGVDALTLNVAALRGADAIVSNPPWTRSLLHPLILHLQTLAPAWLLFDSDWAYNIHAAPYLDQCSDIIAVGRLRWIPDTNQTGKDNTSWYRFWHAHRGGPHFHGRK